MRRLRVAVIMGGASAEREVSLASGRKVLANLDAARYQALPFDLQALPARAGKRALALRPLAAGPETALDAGIGGCASAGAHHSRFALGGRRTSEDNCGHWLPRRGTVQALAGHIRVPENLANGHVEVAFLALHGGAGEDGTIQGLLELVGLPYTGSGVLASALAMNKILSKQLFLQEGIPTPPFLAARGSHQATAGAEKAASELGFPLVVKPACQGSTVGVSIVRRAAELPAAVNLALSFGPEVLFEQFIAGTEITAGLLGNDEPQVLPLVEIVPASGFYDYEAKYTPGATEEIVPARIPHEQAEYAACLARAAYQLLGCRGLGRVDMIATADEVYVLELNTLPGLTDTSLVPRAAEAAGISYAGLLDRIIELALEAHAPPVAPSAAA